MSSTYQDGEWKTTNIGTHLQLKRWNEVRSKVATPGPEGFVEALALLNKKGVSVEFGKSTTPFVALEMAKNKNVSFSLQIDDQPAVALHDGTRSGVDPVIVRYDNEHIESDGDLRVTDKLHFTFTLSGVYNTSHYISIDSLINKGIVKRTDKFARLSIAHDLFDTKYYAYLQENRIPASRIVFELIIDYRGNNITIDAVSLVSFYDLPVVYPYGTRDDDNYINVSKNPSAISSYTDNIHITTEEQRAIVAEVHERVEKKMTQLSRKVPGFKHAFIRSYTGAHDVSGNLPHFPYGELSDIPIALAIAVLLKDHPEPVFDDRSIIKHVLTRRNRETDPRGHALWNALDRLFPNNQLTLRHLLTHTTGLMQSLPAAVLEGVISTTRAAIKELTTPTTFFLDIDRTVERKQEEELSLIRELNVVTPFTNPLPFPFNVNGPKTFDYAILAMFIEHIPQSEQFDTHAQHIVTKVLVKEKLLKDDNKLIWDAYFNESANALEEGGLSLFKFGQHAFGGPETLEQLLAKLPLYHRLSKEIYSSPVFDENNGLKTGFRNLLWTGFYSKTGVAVLYKEGGFPITGNCTALAIMIPQLNYSAVLAVRYEMMGVLADVRGTLLRILKKDISRITEAHPAIDPSKVPLVTEHAGDIYMRSTTLFQGHTDASITNVLPVGTVYNSPFVRPLTGLNDSFTITENKDSPTSRVDLVSNHTKKIMATIVMDKRRNTFHQLSPDGENVYSASIDITPRRAAIGDNLFFTSSNRHVELEQIKQDVISHESKLINMPIGLYSASSSSVPSAAPLSVIGNHHNQDYTSFLIGCHNTSMSPSSSSKHKKRHHFIHPTSKLPYH
jgi:hypothetical protein